MDVSTHNHLDFVARVQRIEAMRASAQQILFVGTDEAYCLPRRDKTAKISSGRRLLVRLMFLASLVLALALGMLGHAVGQILRFHLLGLPDRAANPDVDMLVQIGVGLLITLALGYVLLPRGRAVTTLAALGVVIGLLLFHNAVHQWPDAFAKVTSGLWVQDVVVHSQPNSLIWRGHVVPLT